MSSASSSISSSPLRSASSLSGKARRQLRALGHHLSAIVLVGKDGLTPALCDATGQALSDHELIKVKLGENAAGDRHSLAADLAARTASELVGLIGRTFLLWKRNENKPKIDLPTERKPGRGLAAPKREGRGLAAPKREGRGVAAPKREGRAPAAPKSAGRSTRPKS